MIVDVAPPEAVIAGLGVNEKDVAKENKRRIEQTSN
jgi:hypothetical protein